MAVQITTYGGLTAAVAAWLARDGDADLAARADDFVALCEQRIYLGADAMPALGLPAFEAIRVDAMYQSDSAFTLSQGVAQPAGFLELVEAAVNTPKAGVLQIVDESIIDDMGAQTADQPRYIAASGTAFRLWPDPGTTSFVGTLRWYGQLATPSGTTPTNWLLSTAPGLYLNGCLIEAALFTGDFDSAVKYGALYASIAAGLNTNRQRKLASAQNVRMKIRGRTP